MNMGQAGHDSQLDQYTKDGYKTPGEIFIHELTHAWQITHAPFPHDVFWRAAQAKLAGQGAYQYGPPGPEWESLGLEQQATIVNEWFAGNSHHMTPALSSRKGQDTNDPYYGYISNNILLGNW
jgi:hypothetical protein